MVLLLGLCTGRTEETIAVVKDWRECGVLAVAVRCRD